MANIKSAKKRILVIEKKTELNKSAKSRINTYSRKFKSAIASKDIVSAEKAYAEISSVLDKAASDNVIHDNCASRRKARFAKALNELKNEAK